MVASVVIVANVVVVVANDEVMNCADDVSHKSSQKFHLSSNAKNFCLKNSKPNDKQNRRGMDSSFTDSKNVLNVQK